MEITPLNMNQFIRFCREPDLLPAWAIPRQMRSTIVVLLPDTPFAWGTGDRYW